MGFYFASNCTFRYYYWWTSYTCHLYKEYIASASTDTSTCAGTYTCYSAGGGSLKSTYLCGEYASAAYIAPRRTKNVYNSGTYWYIVHKLVSACGCSVNASGNVVQCDTSASSNYLTYPNGIVFNYAKIVNVSTNKQLSLDCFGLNTVNGNWYQSADGSVSSGQLTGVSCNAMTVRCGHSYLNSSLFGATDYTSFWTQNCQPCAGG
jgi:hypothetical protein